MDEISKVDPDARVVCETFTKTEMVLIGGEISSNVSIDFQAVTHHGIQQIGYDDSKKGFDYKTRNALTTIEQQSSDIAQCVHEERTMDELGAGDQGLMFGNLRSKLMVCAFTY